MRDFWLIVHFLGLGIGMGASVATVAVLFATRNLPPGERGPIIRGIGVLRHVGPTGLLLLIVSGVMLSLPMLDGLLRNGLFHTKLTLVVVLLGWVGYSHMRVARARRAGTPVSPLPLWLAPLPLVVVSFVILLAVLIFH